MINGGSFLFDKKNMYMHMHQQFYFFFTLSVVCYCSVGYRSSAVAQKLFSQHKRNTVASSMDTQEDRERNEHCHGGEKHKEASVKLDIYNLEGGIFQWACEQREIVNERGEKVNTVHPYSAFWGKLLPAQLRHKF